MGPKRKRGGARTSAGSDQRAAATAAETEDAKPSIDQVDAEMELPSNPLEPAPEPELSRTAAEADVPATTGSPVALSADATNKDIRTPSTSTRGRKLTSQPKSARRSAAQRLEAQKAEDDRKAAATSAKAAEEAAKLRAERELNDHIRHSRSMVGRGGFMGVRHMGVRDSNTRSVGSAAVSGPFSAGQVVREPRGRKSAASGSRGGSRGGSGGRVLESQPRTSRVSEGGINKAEARPSTNDKAVEDVKGDDDGDVKMEESAGEDGGFISSDEEKDEKINVEDLGVIDLTVDDAFAPVRVTRVAHRDKALGINADGATNQEGVITVDANDTTTAISEKRKGKQRAREVEKTVEERRFQATYSDSESDTEIKQDPEGEAAPVQPTSLREPRSSSEARRQPKGKAKVIEPLSSDGIEYQQQDDLEELKRHRDDVAILRHELGTADRDGDAAMAGSDSRDTRTEKVYLFQFPPILPRLKPINVKEEPEVEDDNNNNEAEGMQIDNPIDVDNNNTSSESKKEKPEPPPPSGAVGKLRLHASGKVTLDWGGTSMALAMGTGVSFLQDILVADVPDRPKDGEVGGEEVLKGIAMSMGQVKEKFVVVPDLEEMLR